MTYLTKTNRGFTLMELMFAVTILAILLGFGVPTFRQIIENNRLVTQNNEIVTALNLARSEALRRAGDVTMCASTDGATCSEDTDWSSGWIVFVDSNADGTIADPEQIIQAWPAPQGGFTLNSDTRGFVRYTSTGRSAFAETLTLLKPDCEGDKARELSIALTGRVSTVKASCEES